MILSLIWVMILMAGRSRDWGKGHRAQGKAFISCGGDQKEKQWRIDCFGKAVDEFYQYCT